MAYKKRLSKKKNWTGRELGQLELANFAYMYEQQQAEAMGRKDPTAEDLLFNLDTYLEILRETWKRNPAENDIYRIYIQIENWLGKNYNVAWGYSNTADVALGALESTIDVLSWITLVTGTTAVSDPAITEMLQDAGHRYGELLGGIDDYVWDCILASDNILSYNKAVELTADFFGTPEIRSFLVDTEHLASDLSRCMKRFELLGKLTLKHMNSLTAFLDSQNINLSYTKTNEDSINNALFEITMLERDFGRVPYTEENIKAVQEAFKNYKNAGFSLFGGTALLDFLKDVQAARSVSAWKAERAKDGKK